MPTHAYLCTIGHEFHRHFPLGKKKHQIKCACGNWAMSHCKDAFPSIQFKGDGFTRQTKDVTAQHTEKFYKDNGLVPKSDIVVDCEQFRKMSPAYQNP